MQVVKAKRGMVALPPEMARRVGPDAEFAVVTVGDTIILKRVTPFRLAEVAKRAPKDRPMSLREISDEVHRHRRTRRIGRIDGHRSTR